MDKKKTFPLKTARRRLVLFLIMVFIPATLVDLSGST